MHGVKRSVYEAVPQKEKEAKLAKIVHYIKLTKVVLKAHREKVYSEKMFALVGTLIEINPDFYSLWNYRRECVLQYLKKTPEKKASICAAELKISEAGLKKNYKSYYAWHHRIWTIGMGTTDLKAEIDLCTKYLKADSRNFHCWNYRRYVMMVGKVSLMDELKFSSSKIDENFSNYSAWHHRSFIIPKLIESAPKEDIQKLIDEEFSLLQQAFFTDPGDQSAWLYHRWLLGQVVALGISRDSKISSSTEPTKAVIEDNKGQIKIIKRELAMVEELVEVEPGCKW
eukprot:CAMPEP_0167761448 /NCGR_PEP_ID=MMETSP0110_2-20121227/12180_1 /TAXON_ID=629695 /ORGANISM="Gymnochlora sp., Strain CCMP2014" /LENGTH=283 /DNA_ID=CAMNT_0007648137 /DNA_START=115 /DNA_END=963 /DNA_ORIENTATION=-